MQPHVTGRQLLETNYPPLLDLLSVALYHPKRIVGHLKIITAYENMNFFFISFFYYISKRKTYNLD